MPHRYRPMLIVSTLILACGVVSGRADEVAEKGRDISKKFQRAVVTVQESIKATASGGRSSEVNLEITGTVIDPSGLTVVALSSCDPTDLRRRVTPDYNVESEVSNVRILVD